MVVRNRWVTKGTQTISGVIDKADFEKIKRKGDQAVYNWIDSQLEGTSVTVVLIGEATLNRPFVHYEICKSLKRGNAIIGVHIHDICDMVTKNTSLKGNVHTEIGRYEDGNSAYFDSICNQLYDYKLDDGYNNLGEWVELAAKMKGK